MQDPRMPGAQTTKQISPFRAPWTIFWAGFLLRVLYITLAHTYRIRLAEDHLQFGWEMGRIARSLALGQGFSSPTDLPTGPSAWAPPIYPYILANIFTVFGIYSAASGWIILAFNSIFGALTCITIYQIGERIYGTSLARAASWTWAVFPYTIYWPVRVVWEASLSAYLLSLALLLTLRIADNPPKTRTWIWFGLLWGIIALTNTALISMLPFFLLWLLYRSQQRMQHFAGMCLSALVIFAIISPWLIRNHSAFGKFIFIRDNLPLEMYVANNENSNGLWTRSEHPGNDPEAMREFQQLGELGFMKEKQRQVRQFVLGLPGQMAFELPSLTPHDRKTIERICRDGLDDVADLEFIGVEGQRQCRAVVHLESVLSSCVLLGDRLSGMVSVIPRLERSARLVVEVQPELQRFQSDCFIRRN